jgi:hypothetical protein
MIRTLLIGSAALALAACGDGGASAEANNAAAAEAAANLAEVMPNELAEDDQSDANLGNAAEAPAVPPAAAQASRPHAARPAAKAAPRAEPRRPAAPKAATPPTRTQTEPDPHAGHDMDNMSHD